MREERNMMTSSGEARVVVRKGKVDEVFLDGMAVEGLASDRRLFGLDRVVGSEAEIVEVAARILVERSMGIEAAHKCALEILSPPEVQPPLELQGRFQLDRDWSDGPPTNLETDFKAKLYYSYGHHDLIFEVMQDGSVVPLFDDATLDAVRLSARLDSIWDSMPEVEHPVFGRFKPDRLVTVAPQKLGWFGRQVQVDVWMPEREIERFDVAVLEPFVPLIKGLKKAVPKVAAALAPLRVDWAHNWLDPLNEPMAEAFRAAFPGLKSGEDLTEADFLLALWLRRVTVAPFEESGPQVTWDFYGLPDGEDDQIFVARTDPQGRILEVTTES